jgi:endonuclease III
LAAADNDEGARRFLRVNGMSTIRSGKALALKKRQRDQRGAIAKKLVGKAAAKKPSGTVNGANDLTKKPAPANLKAQAARVVERLKADYPGAICALENETPFELLAATILSAQCTDARVNMVTPELFRRWPTAVEMADAPIKELVKVIQSTGFYRNKAKNIKAASQAIVERHDGDVPRDMEQLVALPGVGRKTANVVLGTAFGMATGVVVDTHVTRLSQRLGLTKHTDAVKIEQDLMRIVPQEEWVDFSHRLIFHGRQICVARKPKCPECSMRAFCPKIGVLEVKSRETRVKSQKAGKRQELRVKSQKGPG